MAVVLNTQISLNPNNQIAHLVDTTGLVLNSQYVISGTYLQQDTRFTFAGNLDITLTRPPLGVPGPSTLVSCQVSTIPAPAAPPPPAKYPYAVKDRLLASNLNLDLSSNPGTTPPSSGSGQATRGKFWLDTSVTPPQLRVCAVAIASVGYVAGEWSTIGPLTGGSGVVDLSGYMPLNGDSTKNGSLTVMGSESIFGNRLYINAGNPLGAIDAGVTLQNSVRSWAIQNQGSAGAGELWFYDYGANRLTLALRTNGDASFARDVTCAGALGASNGYFTNAVTCGYLIANGAVQSTGSSAELAFDDRGGGTGWLWYSSGNIARLYNGADRLTIAADGSLTAANVAASSLMNVGGIQFYNNGGQFYIANGSGINTPYLLSRGNIDATSGSLTVLNLNATNYGEVHNQFTVFGNEHVNGNLNVFGSEAIRDSLTVGARLVMSSDDDQQLQMTTGGAVMRRLMVNGRADIYDLASSLPLHGGYGDAGMLKTPPGTVIYFNWDGQDVSYVMDNSYQRFICPMYNARDLQMANVGAGPTGWHLAVSDRSGNNFVFYADVASDVRLKDNIVESEIDALGLLCSVPVRQFDFKREYVGWMASADPKMNAATRQRVRDEAEPYHVAIGLVAQEVMPLVPEAVVADPRDQPDGSPVPADTHYVVYETLVPYLVRAVQQLAERVQTLEGSMT